MSIDFAKPRLDVFDLNASIDNMDNLAMCLLKRPHEVAKASAYPGFSYREMSVFHQALLKVWTDLKLVVWEPDIWDFSAANAESAFKGVRPTEELQVESQIWMTRKPLVVELPPLLRSYKEALPYLDLATIVVTVRALIAAHPPLAKEMEMILKVRPDGLIWYHAMLPLYKGTPEQCAKLPIGWKVPRFIAPARPQMYDTLCDPDYYSVLARLHFLQSKYATLRPQHLHRPDARRREREHKPTPPIQVVTLRQAQTAGDSQSNTSVQHGALTCRFWVSPHWRANYRDPNKPIWVESYIKGNPAYPMKTHSRKVYHAAR